MWLLTIHHSFCLSPVLLLVGISGIKCAQQTIFPTLNTGEATAASAFLRCIYFETECKLPKFSGVVVSARANQYSKNVKSSFRSLILNSRCSCHGRSPFREVPCPLVLDDANIVYPYESTDVFRDEFHYAVPIQRQVSIHT
jgi:hypothetical protein